ncbi:MAG: AmmeMemoRadiSam system radical SAM enzyme [Spirochaetaceae bacterium]
MSFTEDFRGKLKCTLCPHGCILDEGKSGVCRVRKNQGGELSLPYYGVLSAVSTDPIEKKPLYHFYPGSSIFSIGFYGCSFSCPFCQNYRIAHFTPAEGAGPGRPRKVEPEEIVKSAQTEGATGIAYTYSEPLVHFEWVLETAHIASRAGLRNVLVSNGYINREPARQLLPYIDAANIDLKSFNPDYYTGVIGGRLQPVLDFIQLAAQHSHIEVTTLVIPGETDSHEEIESIAGFLSQISPDIPYHLSCYYPTYKYTIPPTDPKTVFELMETAKKKLNYVYPGNVGLSETNSECPECGNTLVTRRGYKTSVTGITRGSGGEVQCSSCGISVPFLIEE